MASIAGRPVAAGSDPGTGGFTARVPAARGYPGAIKWTFIWLLTVGWADLRDHRLRCNVRLFGN